MEMFTSTTLMEDGTSLLLEKPFLSSTQLPEKLSTKFKVNHLN